MSFKETVEFVALMLESAGVVAVVGGIVVATGTFVRRMTGLTPREEAYRGYRAGIGRAILLSLEFLVAADIIKTVSLDPTFESVGVLALIVLVRTFLSFTLELEVEGRWPWEARAVKKQAKAAAAE